MLKKDGISLQRIAHRLQVSFQVYRVNLLSLIKQNYFFIRQNDIVMPNIRYRDKIRNLSMKRCLDLFAVSCCVVCTTLNRK